MKKNYELYLFILLQICLVLAYIYKESRSMETFYQGQRLEKKYDELTSQAKDLHHQLQALKNRSAIQQYARQNGLEPLSLSSVRHIDAHQPT
jgi:cell division protein FtsL